MTDGIRALFRGFKSALLGAVCCGADGVRDAEAV
jgi:hypothetical protein